MDKDFIKIVIFPLMIPAIGLLIFYMYSFDSFKYGNWNISNKFHELEDRISELEEEVYGG